MRSLTMIPGILAMDGRDTCGRERRNISGRFTYWRRAGCVHQKKWEHKECQT